MSITIDFILIFILIIIPGLLFNRFYFFSEFSKQFSTKDSIYKSVFYSIIPGIFIQVIAYFIFILIHQPKFNNEDLICIFKELLSSNLSYSQNTVDLLNKKMYLFLIHEVNVFILSAILGIALSRLVRFLKLDILTKIFRFKNQWYYIFSGEIRSFKKFKIANNILGEIRGEDNKYQYYPPYIDVLVENNKETTLYSGYVVDYDLDYENIKNLDRIYLLGAHRYRDIRPNEDLNGLEVSGSKIKTQIKGDVFILNANRILNLNITFIPSPKEKEEPKEINRNWLSWVHNIGALLNAIVFVYVFFIKSILFSKIIPLFTNYTAEFNWGKRLLLALIITQLISIALPNVENKKDIKKLIYYYHWKNLVGKILILLILCTIYYFIIYK